MAFGAFVAMVAVSLHLKGKARNREMMLNPASPVLKSLQGRCRALKSWYRENIQDFEKIEARMEQQNTRRFVWGNAVACSVSLVVQRKLDVGMDSWISEPCVQVRGAIIERQLAFDGSKE